jgi:beta-lactam-binding protein with PASTA domain
VNNASGALSALRRLSIAIAIAVVFLFGLATTVYLSLRSPEVTVPDVLGKDRFEAERILGSAGLNFRVRANRPSSELKADTVLFQLPRAGEVVKVGQTVAMDISRSVKEGESSEVVAPEKKPEEKAETRNTNDNAAANENKPRKKNTNKNANSNENSNSNSGTRNANSNRPSPNKNANIDNANTPTSNANRPPLIINNNARDAGSNDNRGTRPPAPKPSPQ